MTNLHRPDSQTHTSTSRLLLLNFRSVFLTTVDGLQNLLVRNLQKIHWVAPTLLWYDRLQFAAGYDLFVIWLG